VNKLPAKMGYEDSLSCSQHPTTGQYLNHFNPVHTQALSGAILILASHIQTVVFPSCFPIQVVYEFLTSLISFS